MVRITFKESIHLFHYIIPKLYMFADNSNHSLEAFEACFSPESKFNYTLFFVALVPIFWLFEFLCLRTRPDFDPSKGLMEPTDLKEHMIVRFPIAFVY